MEKITGNEPAQAITHGGIVYKGLTIRQYFAVMAPPEVPGFFRHSSPNKNISPMPVWYNIQYKADAELCRDWLQDGIFDLPDHLQWFSDAVKKSQNEEEEWNIKNEQERYFQWITFFANSLINELNKETK